MDISTPPPATAAASPSPRELWIAYDGECPLCRAYVTWTRLHKAVGTIHMVDARKGGPLIEEIKAAGLNLNQGMAMKWGGTLYHGDACMHQLALMTSRSGLFNRMMAWLFSSPTRAKLLYPYLRGGRRMLLCLLGRKPL